MATSSASFPVDSSQPRTTPQSPLRLVVVIPRRPSWWRMPPAARTRPTAHARMPVAPSADMPRLSGVADAASSCLACTWLAVIPGIVGIVVVHDARMCGTRIPNVWRRRGAVQEPIRGGDALRRVGRAMHASWHRERRLREVLLRVEHAVVPDWRGACHAVHPIHIRVVVVPDPYAHGVVHGIAHGPVVRQILAGACLGRCGPYVG